MTVDARTLREALRRFEHELDRVVPSVLAMSADRIVAHARTTTLFRDRSGNLRRSILRGPITGSFRGDDLAIDLMAGVGLRYGRFVHDGTAPHEIRPRRREALRMVIGGRFVFAKKVNHPGTAPRPFLAVAVAETTPNAERSLAQAIELAAARAGLG